ncbi:carboxylesterase/lipase family protein [Rhodococcus sp. BP-349]|uniref:carboxylesterase/lipase family protein n=1 Tax=unclassified Rhodococcus (in: high G+C Gram-positive bacteria) TaxID=192944 RepID=UPI001C9B4E1F|nr:MULTISPECIES: carboxylesterase family protein [unclassified Rhodococcus (in: high G+C Gram-positive bacteria)]MBY6537692.1 carboxylesterase/lipase family protein [Rhodococcus sp. BP-363]MBY6542029.1 carboxylesterase/lipase family protein [Rhodococcus sp. BP-369]MBY6561259.1 carboxylesterase/lipase family protein [Rhodococcus sp. BP-370]MBY6575551.1 carboxylesterase/lipase family protein [Rhodococcus sp. BP-364]MBY6584852.1 carboxylesterase/lipase family protein [Rhodococcus sp. BP-358]
MLVVTGCSTGSEQGAAAGTGTQSAATGEDPIVRLAAGSLRGINSDGLNVYKGIPYAAPPVGNLRFRAPRAVVPWSGERDARTLGHPSVQTNADLSPWLDPQPESEDCLVLNVWAPESGSAGKPVMFWIHGGGYQVGSAGAPLYDGANLARTEDVVVVGVNHRLNTFGYMWLGDLVPELAGDGNLGQRDLVAALGWVRDNVAAFGGDPSNVTVFGESGGGGKVSSLLATPSARGLFHRAIVQSGSALEIQTREQATEAARATLAKLGDGTFDVNRLQQIGVAELKAVSGDLGAPYGPVLDGDFMPHQTWEGGAPAESAGVAMMIGNNTHEIVLFQPDFADPIADDAQLEQRFRAASFSPALSPEQYRGFLEGHRALQPTADRHHLLAAMTSDPAFFRDARQQADLKAAQNAGDVFLYECTWETPCFGGQWAVHAGEIPLVFGILSYESAWDGLDSDAARAAADPQNHQARLSREMMAAWARFARDGNPSSPALDWPRWDDRTRSTMVFAGEKSVSVSGYADERLALVEGFPKNPIL